MTSRDFCFWLQGFFELREAGEKLANDTLTQQQVEAMQRHLALVFKHQIDPSMGPEPHQATLNETHGPQPHGGPAFQVGGGGGGGGGLKMRC